MAAGKPDVDAAREGILWHAQRMAAEGLVVGTSGNISTRVGDLIALTPGSTDYGALRRDDISLVSIDGESVGGLAPSSELLLHLGLHQSRPAAGTSVVHTHSRYATTLATLGWELPAIHYQIASMGGAVRLARYGTFGTPELAANVAEALDGRSAALMESHGAVTIGTSLAEAYRRAATLEWLCEVYYHARIAGAPRLIEPDELERVKSQQARFAQQRKGWAPPEDRQQSPR